MFHVLNHLNPIQNLPQGSQPKIDFINPDFPNGLKRIFKIFKIPDSRISVWEQIFNLDPNDQNDELLYHMTSLNSSLEMACRMERDVSYFLSR